MTAPLLCLVQFIYHSSLSHAAVKAHLDLVVHQSVPPFQLQKQISAWVSVTKSYC